MIDKNAKKCNRMKRIVDFITVVIGVMIAVPISDQFFNGQLLWTINILIIALLVLSRLEVFINKKIDAYFDAIK